MAFSKYVVTFQNPPNAGEILTIIDSLTGQSIKAKFELIRVNFGECRIGTDEGTQAYNYQKQTNIDYNNTGLYTITYDTLLGTVTVQANNAESQFSLAFNDALGVSVVFDNVAPSTEISLGVLAATEADSNPCDNIKLSVTTNIQASAITSPIAQAVATNPFVFTMGRADLITLTMEEVLGSSFTQQFRAPRLLSEYFGLDILNTPNGGTLTITRLAPLNAHGNPAQPLVLTYLYSLDGITYRSVDSISNLAPDNYTLYIKDSGGCEITIPFEIEAFEGITLPVEPIFEVSNVNSFRFKKNIAWSDCGIRKSVLNTLSFEERDFMPITKYVQLINKCDNITTQIKTSYETVEAVLTDCDDNEIVLTPTKKTTNMDKVDVRDGYILNHTEGDYTGQLGLYFGAGETYDPITLLANGSYNLAQSIMSWIDVGEYVNLQGIGWLRVEAIIPAQSGVPFSGDSLVLGALSSAYSLGDNTKIQTTSRYNVVDWERWEFPIDFSTLEGHYQIKINGEDILTNYPDVEFLSEYLSVEEKHDSHFQIDYYNTENNEINYFTGIRNKVRIPYTTQLKWSPKSSVTTYDTDTNTVLQDANVREFYAFNALPLPTAMAQKLVMILVHDRLMIDGELYTIEGEPSAKAFGRTNLYQVTASLVKADYVFDTDSGKGLVELPTGIPLAIDENSNGLLFVE